MTTLQVQWEAFAHHALPLDAPALQRRMLQKTYYAGALATLELLTGLAEALEQDAALDEAASLTAIRELYDECEALLRRQP